MSDYRINEVFLNAQILNEKVLIVEGVDDVTLYQNMFSEEDYEIYAIENLEKIHSESGEHYQPGCEGVKTAINDLVENEDGNTTLLKENLLGIVDKDVSDYRNEIFESDIVVNLRHYAIENHFLVPEAVYLLLKKHTKSGGKLVDQDFANELYVEIIGDLNILYLITLDSLKGAVNSDYTSVFGYSSTDECYKNMAKVTELTDKEAELLEFADQLNISYNEDFLKNATKGKWALSAFCDFLYNKISEISSKCRNGEIPQCQFCRTGSHTHCLYKFSEGITKKTLKTLTFGLHELGSLQYIKQEVNEKFSN